MEHSLEAFRCFRSPLDALFEVSDCYVSTSLLHDTRRTWRGQDSLL
jgi:hypothetical protein